MLNRTQPARPVTPRLSAEDLADLRQMKVPRASMAQLKESCTESKFLKTGDKLGEGGAMGDNGCVCVCVCDVWEYIGICWNMWEYIGTYGKIRESMRCERPMNGDWMRMRMGNWATVDGSGLIE